MRPVIGLDPDIPVFDINPIHFYKQASANALKSSVHFFQTNSNLIYNILINLIDLRSFISTSNINLCAAFDKSFDFDLVSGRYSLPESVNSNAYYEYKLKCKTDILNISEQIDNYVKSAYYLKKTPISQIISRENFYFSNIESSLNDLVYTNQEYIVYSISIEIEYIYPLLVNLKITCFKRYFLFNIF